jgi:hypothetical protein
VKAASFIALALSLAASLVAAGAYFRVRSQPAAAAPAGNPGLEARVAGLEARLRDSQPVSKPDPGHSHGEDDLDALRRDVEALKKQVGSGRFPGPDTGRVVRPNPAMIDDLKKRLLNPSQPLRARAQTIGALRSQQAHKTDDVIDAAMALFSEAAADQTTRALIIRNLRGAENPRLADSLIQILTSDPDEDVRDEAARLLGADYLASKPEARPALEQAAANDASPKVKRTAQAALAAPPRPR